MMEISTLLLGTIAVSTLVMAAVQVVIIIYGARLGKRVNRLVDQVEKELQPALSRVNAMSGDANRATSLAVAQLERADQLFARLTERFDYLMTLTQDAVVEPVRQGAALLQGLRAALAAFLGETRSAGTRPAEPTGEDEEALFIG